MKIAFDFKGSLFNQRERIFLTLKEKATIYEALQFLAKKRPVLGKFLLIEGALRNDILIMIDHLDVKALQLLEMPLQDGQIITILPLAHGG